MERWPKPIFFVWPQLSADPIQAHSPLLCHSPDWRSHLSKLSAPRLFSARHFWQWTGALRDTFFVIWLCVPLIYSRENIICFEANATLHFLVCWMTKSCPQLPFRSLPAHDLSPMWAIWFSILGWLSRNIAFDAKLPRAIPTMLHSLAPFFFFQSLTAFFIVRGKRIYVIYFAVKKAKELQYGPSLFVYISLQHLDRVSSSDDYLNLF